MNEPKLGNYYWEKSLYLALDNIVMIDDNIQKLKSPLKYRKLNKKVKEASNNYREYAFLTTQGVSRKNSEYLKEGLDFLIKGQEKMQEVYNFL